MSSLPDGKLYSIPRCSTRMPSGCSRPALNAGLPSHERNHTSDCDADTRPRSSGLNSASLASPAGTSAASGQFSTSSGLLALKIGRNSSPTLSPRGLKNCAPVVSPRHSGLASGPMRPATWIPELNTYWSAVPLGQKPPPIVDELVESTQISPVLERPQ